MRYRRTKLQGGTFFFTVNTANRSICVLTDHIQKLKFAFRTVKYNHPFHIDAVVILPDHLHTIWTLPPGDSNYGRRWALIKSVFSRNIPVLQHEYRSDRRIEKGERGIWQRRFWEHAIRDEADYQRHVDYIHYNPVKHGYVKNACDWPFSSIHKYIRKGWLEKDWGSSEIFVGDGKFGE